MWWGVLLVGESSGSLLGGVRSLLLLVGGGERASFRLVGPGLVGGLAVFMSVAGVVGLCRAASFGEGEAECRGHSSRGRGCCALCVW